MVDQMKVFMVVYGHIPEELVPCVNSVKYYYPQTKVYRYPKNDNAVIDSDNFRADILCKYDNILYIDWDVFLSGRLFLDKTMVMTNFLKGTPDYSIIYSPEAVFWQELIKERDRRGISDQMYGWIRKMLLSHEDKIKQIKGNYYHARWSGLKQKR